jgi:hypothetical protein
MKILSCIPKQVGSWNEKIQWLYNAADENPCDIFIMPQEYFGGIQNLLFDTSEPLHYQEPVIIEAMLAFAKVFNIGVAAGALIKDEQLNQVRERIYIIDPDNGVTGYYDKMMLPAYDHINAKGKMRVTPETIFSARRKKSYIKGALVSVLFCWEVWSNFIWHELCLAQPDFLINMIKFGVSGYPQKKKNSNGESIVTGFGYGDDGGWMDRLISAARFDIAAPIFSSTNSWNQPNRARPLCGMINPFGDDTLWYPPKGTRGDIQEKIIVDEIDPFEFRYNRGSKYAMNEDLGKWPTSEARKQTMAWKIRRMERKMIGLDNKINKPSDEFQTTIL